MIIIVVRWEIANKTFDVTVNGRNSPMFCCDDVWVITTNKSKCWCQKVLGKKERFPL